MALQGFGNRFGVGLPQPPIQPRQFGGRNGFGIHRRQHGTAQCGRKREAGVGKQF